MAPAGNAAPVEPGQVTMAATALLLLIFRSLIQYLQMAGDGLDEDTRLRMELRANRLNRQMTRLLQELEQGPLEHSVIAWGALPWTALQHWHLWALAGVLVLLSGLWFSRRRSHEADNNGEETKEQDNDDVYEVEEANVDNSRRGIPVQMPGWPIQDLKRGCEMTTVLMENFIFVFQHTLSNGFHPLPQRAIGVGSAFEGWSPRREVTEYCVLVPLNPPPGHTFHLEQDTSQHIPGRKFRIRVEQVCTCTGQQQGENVRCLIHPSEKEQRENEEPSFLNSFCTGSYLDVEKTARWFYQLVRASWGTLPESHNWHLMLLPSSRSCKFTLTRSRESLTVEMLFGVQRGDSDIFVSSQNSEALLTPSTMWPETYSVAEVKFFSHITSQAPRDSWHLKCLKFLSCALQGTIFSTYTLKTVVMHLLNTVPVSQWGSRQFLQRLGDTMHYLHCSLLEKHLDHFIVGNQHLPEVIRLPLDIQNSEPSNLFHDLVQNPGIYTLAMRDYPKLQDHIRRIVLFGK